MENNMSSKKECEGCYYFIKTEFNTNDSIGLCSCKSSLFENDYRRKLCDLRIRHNEIIGGDAENATKER
jgi:hypothetical protein